MSNSQQRARGREEESLAGISTEAILESISDGVFTVDREWKITSFNRAAADITGISRKDALGRRCSEVFRASMCESECALKHTIDTGNPIVNRTAFIVDAQGKRIPISVSTALLRAARRKPKRVERDLTDTILTYVRGKSPMVYIEVIGRIRTPYREAEGTPIQPIYAQNAEGQVVVDDPFTEALDDIDGFERIWLLYWMDRVVGFKPKVVPYRDTRERGLFATRSPCRPNPIGISAVRLVRRENNVLHVVDVDVLDNTALIDIKPYVPEFDAYPASRAGWFETSNENRKVADSRFHR